MRAFSKKNFASGVLLIALSLLSFTGCASGPRDLFREDRARLTEWKYELNRKYPYPDYRVAFGSAGNSSGSTGETISAARSHARLELSKMFGVTISGTQELRERSESSDEYGGRSGESRVHTVSVAEDVASLELEGVDSSSYYVMADGSSVEAAAVLNISAFKLSSQRRVAELEQSLGALGSFSCGDSSSSVLRSLRARETLLRSKIRIETILSSSLLASGPVSKKSSSAEEIESLRQCRESVIFTVVVKDGALSQAAELKSAVQNALSEKGYALSPGVRRPASMESVREVGGRFNIIIRAEPPKTETIYGSIVKTVSFQAELENARDGSKVITTGSIRAMGASNDSADENLRSRLQRAVEIKLAELIDKTI